ncbi:MAG: hypothetical protein FP829_01340 [Nitrospirae bacterium]|nr:hypothetical protein [Nitrospirota bacterium]
MELRNSSTKTKFSQDKNTTKGGEGEMKRNSDENYEDYRARRKSEALQDKRILLGKYVWFSKQMSSKSKGMTFVKEGESV